jgi:transposase-like protein
VGELRHALEMDALTESSNGSPGVEGKQRKWSVEDRLCIVQASLKNGTTVNAVAKVYGVHPSQIYNWRKQYRGGKQRGKTARLLPVQVTEAAQSAAPETNQNCGVVIEARSARVTFNGCIDVAVVRAVLECLVR